ncbi:hypothetical protein IM538_05605 [Cytobacillus suaedae]|nr:hypothetical protein IM538_05605 [Cytobacillus suaedae]
MFYFLLSLLLINAYIGYRGYFFLQKKRKLYNERFSMVITMSVPTILSLVFGLLISFIIPFDLGYTLMLACLLGAGVGISFGSFVKWDTILSGFYNGVLGGMMGTMLGAVVKDPTICGLPADENFNMIINSISINLFGTALLLLTFWCIHYH